MGSVRIIQLFVFGALLLVIFGLSAWALIDLLVRPASAFVSAGKRTKTFWGLILGACVLVSFLAAPPAYLIPVYLALLPAVGAAVYLTDVRPAVAPYSRRRRGPRGPSSGGW
ncbi:DUF2516 family protein [Cellulomonas massiliensis]|uniref:DUF2516 family protein n=1 Tax=Cellulomonas massiliensis TaxID=1465811 RepID=UPI0003038933|nr:DUF2516 family protein [Cellulomonas massiliensis]